MPPSPPYPLSAPSLRCHVLTAIFPDRVFAHALQTVRKLPRAGSARPPAADRLRLYGLYKQAMEGDVEGVMARPAPAAAAELEKWEAWAACAGLARTRAKTRYIDALLATMHAYASGTSDSRALVAELEFVWEQVRSNMRTDVGVEGGGSGSGAAEARRESRSPARGRRRPSLPGSRGAGTSKRTDSGLRLLRPMSEADVEEEREFAEAPEEMAADDDDDDDEAGEGSRPDASPDASRPPARRWQARVEQAVVRLTAEVAAVREQLDGANRSLWAMTGRRRLTAGPGRPGTWFRWTAWLAWRTLRRALVDALVVAVLLALWRLRDALRDKRGGGGPRALGRSGGYELGALERGVGAVEAWVAWLLRRWREGLRRRVARGGGL